MSSMGPGGCHAVRVRGELQALGGCSRVCVRGPPRSPIMSATGLGGYSWSPMSPPRFNAFSCFRLLKSAQREHGVANVESKSKCVF